MLPLHHEAIAGWVKCPCRAGFSIGNLRLPEIAERVEDGLGGLSVGEAGRVDAHAGSFAVEGFAGLVKVLQGAARVGGLEKGAFAVAHALMKVVGVGIKPDDRADLREEGAIFGGNDDAAARGDDQADASDEALQGGCFESAEVLLAVSAEDFGDGQGGLLGDKGVGIDKGETGERGKEAPDA